MLKQRILTAIPLALVAIWLIFFQPTESVFYALLIVALISGWEWSRLSGIASTALRIVYAILITATVYVLQVFMQETGKLFDILMLLSITWWAYVLYRMATTKPAEPSEKLSPYKLIIGFVTLVPALLALVHVHGVGNGPYWLFYMVSIIWVADIGAYFAGKTFGKNKLAPLVSPGKTREGLYGGVVATTLYTMLASFYFELNFIQITMLLIVAFFATLLSVVGDLFISVLKRERGIKDSGSILPGHGGILDRIDSVTSSAPFFIFFLELLIFNV